MLWPSVNVLNLYLKKGHWCRGNKERCLWQVPKMKLGIGHEGIRIKSLVPALLHVFVCHWKGGKSRKNALVYLPLLPFSYMILHTLCFSHFSRLCMWDSSEILFNCKGTKPNIILASHVSGLFVLRRSFYYLFFTHWLMLCCSGAPRR